MDFKSIFIFIAIFLLIIGIINRTQNKVFYLLIAGFIYFTLKENNIISKIDKEQKPKKKLRPSPRNINNYGDLEDFVFHIQEFILFNHPAFEEMVDSIDNFLDIYDESIKLNQRAKLNYYNLEKEKHSAINALHSIIFESPPSPQIVEKLNMSIKELDKILDKYLNKIKDIVNGEILVKGYTNKSIIINNGPKEYNFYDNKEFIYDFV